MKFRNQFRKYMAPAQDGSEGGSGGQPDNGSGDDGGTGGDGDAEKAELLKEVMKKKGRIKDLESSNTDLEAKVNELTERYKGVDLERYTQLLEQADTAAEAARKAEEERLKSEGKIEELLKARSDEHDGILTQMREQHGSELEALKEQLKTKDQAASKLVSQIEELTVGSAFGNSALIRDDMVTAMTPSRMRALYGAYFETADDGSVIGYDKPRNVEGRTQLVDKDGKPVGFDEALTRILQKEGDYDSMIRNKADGGSGSGSSNRKPNKQAEIGKGIDRISYALNHQQ